MSFVPALAFAPASAVAPALAPALVKNTSRPSTLKTLNLGSWPLHGNLLEVLGSEHIGCLMPCWVQLWWGLIRLSGAREGVFRPGARSSSGGESHCSGSERV